MTQPNSKIGAYIAQRVLGIDPQQSALIAGYSQSGLAVAASRNETREDVRTAIRKAKRDGTYKPAPSTMKPGASKRQYRSVANEPEATGDSPLEPWKLRDKYDSPLDLLQDVMNNPKAPGGLRIQCAKDALPYCHARKEAGKKEEKEQAGKKAANRFPTQAVPLRRAA